MPIQFLKLNPEAAGRMWSGNKFSRHTCESDGAYRYLALGDIFINGDEYGMPSFRFVIGTSSTGIKSGEIVCPAVMCYHPRRPLDGIPRPVLSSTKQNAL